MSNQSNLSIFVLGTAQDGGFPHVGCMGECCIDAWENPNSRRMVSSIALVDTSNKKFWIIDISPDIKDQLYALNMRYNWVKIESIEGIFLTHSHYGHYSGLLNFGLEVMNLSGISVYAMPKMTDFLLNNISTKKLVDEGNIIMQNLDENSQIMINQISHIKPFLVPHRSENTETVGFNIQGEFKSLVYIPDIDSWEKWEQDISKVIVENDYALIDGTFFSSDELKDRDMSRVPHPLISQSMDLFSILSKNDRKKIFFTHLNHTNKAINSHSSGRKSIEENGYHIAEDYMVMDL